MLLLCAALTLSCLTLYSRQAMTLRSVCIACEREAMGFAVLSDLGT